MHLDATTTLEPPLVPVEGIAPAYAARLERLGAFSEDDKRNEVFRRHRRVLRALSERDRKRIDRILTRSAAEREADRVHRERLFRRRENLYINRFRAIEEQVVRDRKIRPAGKSVASVRRYRVELSAALANDPEYRILLDRRSHANALMERIRRRQRWIEAGVLAIDDRATRHRKMREFLAGHPA